MSVEADTETAACFRSAEPRISEDIEASQVSEASRQNARDAGVRSYVLLPLVIGGEAIGTFYAAWAEPRRLTSGELSFLEAVAAESATGLQNARLYEAERRAQQRAHQELERTELLQAVTTTATSSLSLDEIGRRVPALTTQAIGASGGAIYTVDEAEGRLRALALAGYPAEVASQVDVVPLDERFSIGYLVVHDLPLITHEADYIGPSSEQFAQRLSADETRWFALPIKRADTTLGVFGLMFAGERPFAEDELSLYRSIAELLGAALENARLFEAEHHIATTLQENFVHALPAIDGLELAALSLPAARTELVGGDFHDVFVLPNGMVLALIGDVMGKGIKAAGLTETVRSAVRTAALISPDPEFVLRHVNDLLLNEEGHRQFVTVLLVMLDPGDGRGFVASAGHPTPVRVSVSGVELIEPPFGPPLGALEEPYLATHFELRRGEVLVLYTDGLTEAPRCSWRSPSGMRSAAAKSRPRVTAGRRGGTPLFPGSRRARAPLAVPVPPAGFCGRAAGPQRSAFLQGRPRGGPQSSVTERSSCLSFECG